MPCLLLLLPSRNSRTRTLSRWPVPAAKQFAPAAAWYGWQCLPSGCVHAAFGTLRPARVGLVTSSARRGRRAHLMARQPEAQSHAGATPIANVTHSVVTD